MTIFKYKVIKNLKPFNEENGLRINYEMLFEFQSPLHIQKGDWINRVDFDVSISRSYSKAHEKVYGGYANMFLHVRARMLQPHTIYLVVEEKSLGVKKA